MQDTPRYHFVQKKVCIEHSFNNYLLKNYVLGIKLGARARTSNKNQSLPSSSFYLDAGNKVQLSGASFPWLFFMMLVRGEVKQGHTIRRVHGPKNKY